jgi:small multidrug resistance pump
MKHVIALVLALALNAAANLMMKAGASQVERTGGFFAGGPWKAVQTLLSTPVLVIGLICFALNAAFYMYALSSRTLSISIAYPLMVGGGYAIIATTAYLLLGERLSAGQWVGVALILGGVFLVAIQTAERAA